MFDPKKFVEGFYEKHSSKGQVPGHKVKIGEDYRLENGDKVTIKDGQYWGENGVSNYWYWYNHETEKNEHGYGYFYYLNN